MADSKHPDEAMRLKPLSDEICASCGEPIDPQPGVTFTASTDGRVWHYGCSPSRTRPAVSSLGDDEMVKAEPFEKLIADAYQRGWNEACQTIIEDQAGDPFLMPHKDAMNEGCGCFMSEVWPKLRAAIAAMTG
jgi:hypothetical protein